MRLRWVNQPAFQPEYKRGLREQTVETEFDTQSNSGRSLQLALGCASVRLLPTVNSKPCLLVSRIPTLHPKP